VAALAYSLTQEQQYSASSSLLFRDPGFDEGLFGGQGTGGGGQSSPEREAATNERLVGLPEVAARTAQKLGNGLAQGDVLGALDISAEGESDIVRISATHPSPQLAAGIANTHAQEFIRFRREADQDLIQRAQQLLERRLQRLTPGERATERGRALQNQIETLSGLAAAQTGNASQVQMARVPTAPTSPKPVRNTILGALVGLMLGLGLAFLAEQLDRRLKDPEDVEEAFGLPILGTIPQSRAIDRATRQEGGTEPEAEAFRRLRTNLRYFNVDRQIRTVLLTSAGPGEGKTTVSWNLALAAARTGEQVLYLEADLRRPSLSRYIEPSKHGLSSVLAGVAHFDDVLFSVPVGEFQPGEESDAPLVDVISSGPIPPNPADLLRSEQLQSLLSQISSQVDIVLVDSPPALAASDALLISDSTDAVLMVCRANHTRIDKLQRAVEALPDSARIIGVLLNQHKRQGDEDYDYYYVDDSAGGSTGSGGHQTLNERIRGWTSKPASRAKTAPESEA